MEAPVKVLYLISELVLRTFNNKPDAHNNDTVTLNTQSNGRKVDQVNNVKRGSSRGVEEEPRGTKCIAETLVQPDVKLSKCDTNLTSDAPSQVATKNDNALVAVTDWDVWTVNNYQHPEFITVRTSSAGSTGFKIKNPAKVLVCNLGSYSPDTHGCLFDALRALLLRQAWKNALQGLLAYLWRKHGNALIAESVRYKKRPKVQPSRRKRRKQSMDSLRSIPKAVDTGGIVKGQRRRHRWERKREVNSESNTSGADDCSIPFQTRDNACVFAYGYSNQRQYRVPSWTRKERVPPAKPGDCCRPLQEEVELYKDLRVGRDAI